jgi:ribosome biogenesis GTPase / thiamine phosphate phosphatase
MAKKKHKHTGSAAARRLKERAKARASQIETLAASTLADAPTVLGTVIRAGGGFYEVDPDVDFNNLQEMPPFEYSQDDEDSHDEDSHDENSHDEDSQDEDSDDETADDETPQGRTLICTARGLLKHGPREMSQPVSVGDRVSVRVLPTTGPNARGLRLREGYIEEVLPRRSALARSRYNKTAQVSVANLDQVLIVMALREPELNLHRLDRFLVLCEAAELRAVICLNKADLLKKRDLKKETAPIVKLYSELGYKTLVVSSETDEGIEAVRDELRGQISAVLGSSGVGKSSLINAVQPGLRLWVGDVMDIGKGRHTTTEVSLHPLHFGGYIADTPGIKTVALVGREELDVAMCFPEFRELLGQCKFNDCKHLQEPGCAVRREVENGGVAASRYESYVRIMNDPAILSKREWE